MASVKNTNKPTKTNKTSKATKSSKTTETEKVDNNPSIFIPSVFANIDQDRVTSIFNIILGDDCVDRVDFIVPKNFNGHIKWKMCFVHFTHWPNNKTANKLKAKILAGGEQKLVYDDPWFWKILLNKKKPNNSSLQTPKKEIKIIFDDEEEEEEDAHEDDEEEEEEE